jgi:hypothetical protein
MGEIQIRDGFYLLGGSVLQLHLALLPPMASSDGSASGLPRGRARSRTFSSDDPGFQQELDLAAGLPPRAADSVPSSSSSSSSSSRSSSSGSSSGARVLSQKTIQIMTKLDASAAAGGGAAGAAGGDSDEEHSAGSKEPLDEEAAAEAELAEQERRRRAGESLPASSGSNSSGSGSSAASSAGSAGGGGRRGRKAEEPYDVLIKLLMLGDSGVGKSSLMMRYCDNKFSSDGMMTTVGVDFRTVYLDVEGKRVKCQIWDTAGQQKFHVITHSYYKGAHGIVLVYDASDPEETR